MATYDLTSSIPAASQLAAGDILNCPYSGSAKSVTLPQGTYKLEVWGAQGGYRSSSSYGGKGGYSYGTITLSEETIVYLYAGGHPGSGTSSAGTSTARAGGFNGGGYRTAYYGGGGGSDIRIGSNSLKARVIVAGGGGSDGATSKQGMYGGGTVGGSSTENFTAYSNYCGKGGNTTYSGYSTSYTATSQVTSYTSTTSAYYGGFGFGGYGLYASSGYGGAGGGGWYGGSGTYPDGSADDDRGGGGGSGYVYTSSTASQYPSGCLLTAEHYLTDAATVAGNTSFKDYSGSTVTGHSGHGACRITAIEIIQPEDETGNKNLYIKTGANGSLPSGYVELPYIESNGTQYIDTGLAASNGFYVETQVEPLTNVTTTSPIIGSHEAADPYLRNYVAFENGNTFNLGHYSYTTGGTYTKNKKYTIAASTIPNNLFLRVKEESFIFKGTDTNSSRSSKSLYIFWINGYSSGLLSARLYSMKIYLDIEKTQLKRNFIPALRISDNKAGLYDLITSTFYTDVAGGNFIYNRNSYIDNNTIYYIKGNNSTENLGTSGTITNNSVINTPNDLLYFDGNGYLSLSNNIITGTNDWSIDWWEYRLDATDSRAVYHSNYSSRSGYGMLIGYSSSNKIYTYATSANSTWNIFSGLSMGDLKVGEWVHRAMCRKGSNFYTFENGKLISTATSAASIAGNLTPTIGYYDYSTSPKFYGYIKHLRISNIARWTSDFIPPDRNIEHGTNYAKITESYIKVPNKQTASFSSNYYPLKYIESSGTQWINTGFTPNQSSAISIDVQCFGKHSTHAALCSARPTSSTSTNTIMIFLSSGTVWNVDRGGTASNRTAFSTISLTDRITVDLNKHHMSFNKGEVVKNFSATETFTCGGPLALLYDYSHSRYPMKARLYGCKVWDNDTLVRDLIPALRVSDGKAGLYDKVNSTFYTDAAGGNFIYNINDINNSTIYYIKGDSATTNLGSSGTITNSNVSVIGNEMLYFNGSNSGLTLSQNVVTGTNDFTVDWWEHLMTTPSTSSNIYHSNASSKSGYGLTIGHFNPVSNSYVYASSNGTSWDVLSAFNLGTVKVGEWVHRAFVRKGSNFYGFENGKLISTASSSAAIAANLSPTIGLYQHTSNFYLNGCIKQFRISSIPRWTYDFEPPTLSIDNLWKPIESIYLKNTSPSGYTRLEYLESTGTQYTDTGLIPNQSTKTVIDCILPTTSSGSYYICGARESSYVGNYSLQTTSGVYYSKHGTADVSLSIASVDHRMKMIKDGNVFSVDGNLGYNTPVDYTSPNSMYLFACNSAGTVYGLTPCKIYRVQIYQNGETLSRDMVPMLRNSDKKTGFYDLVNNVFYPNLDTTAEFNYVISNGWEKIS